MLDTIIKGGRIVTPMGVGEWDIGIVGEKIVVIGISIETLYEAKSIIDAKGMIVVPGGIEPHIHAASNVQPGIPESVPGIPNAGPRDHSLGAIWGGTTTVVDFSPVPNEGDIVGGIHNYLAVWNGNAYTDYSTHCIFSSANTPDAISRYGELVDAGFPSIKIFTTDTKPPEGRIPISLVSKIDMGRLAVLMEQISKHGGVLAVHGADDEITMYNYLTAKQQGLWDWHNAHLIHSNLVEDLAFRRVLRLAERKGVGMYFVHVTAKEGLEAIAEARSNSLPVYGEVLTLALSFNCDRYKESDGMKYHTFPSLKFEDDRLQLWKGLFDNNLSFTATDSGFTNYVDKTAGRNVLDMRGGNIGIEIRMGIIYTDAVVKQGMSLERYVDVTSTNAAKLLGFYPQKGAIAVGSDADIVIIDPSITKILTIDDLHVRDYSPWEGWDIQGWPVTVLLRGKIMVDDGKLLGMPTDGQLINRKIENSILNRPSF